MTALTTITTTIAAATSTTAAATTSTITAPTTPQTTELNCAPMSRFPSYQGASHTNLKERYKGPDAILT